MNEGPMKYNAAVDLIERNLKAGRGAKTAFIDDAGNYSYADLDERVSRFANLVRRLGIHPEQPRWPRLATDQTISQLPVDHADPAPFVLDALRAAHARD